MNGLSHVRKFIRLLSQEGQELLAQEVSQKLKETSARLTSLESGTKVHELMTEQVEYLKVMNELIGKVQFEKMS